MGIDVDSKLMVGCSYGELEEFFGKIIEEGETSEHEALIDIGEVIECYFVYASPYYDSTMEYWFIGYEIPNYSVPDEDWFNKVHEQAQKFEALTGVKARVRGGCHVW